jgi:leader peptidase (prepilin peptidase)/N-methyltransferase
MPSPLAWVGVAAFGLAIGSFLNVCIWRIPSLVLEADEGAAAGTGLRAVLSWQRDVWRDVGRAVVRLSSPPSSCPACGSRIAWYQNVPVLSWVLLGARCASCRTSISMRYPIVEAATAVMFLLHLVVLGWGPLLPVRLALAASLIVLFAIDLEHQLLPDVITIPGIATGLLASVFLPPGFPAAVAGVLVGGGVLWVVSAAYFRWRGVEGLGFGDVKMLAMVGAFLGWKATILTLLLGSFSGAITGLGLIASGRGTMGLRLPFGTFLALGALVASLWGDALVGWYLSLFPAAGPTA